jgi:hypothetical protein
MKRSKLQISSVYLIICLLIPFSTIAYAAPITYSSDLLISNITILGLNSINITNKIVDYNYNNTSARAVSSDSFVNFDTSSPTTYHGSVFDVSDSGNAYAFASLNYNTSANSIFMGDSYALCSNTMVNNYGSAKALASFAETVYFTAIAPIDITFSFEYSGNDNGIYPGDSNNYSAAGIGYNIANFNDAISRGFAGGLQDAYNYSPGLFTTTMHFDPGETGWFALGASAGSALYIPNPNPAPVPEPSTFIMLGAGVAGIAYIRRKGKK